MPYSSRTIYIPEYGHEAQVRQAMQERIPSFHGAGIRASVWQEVAGPDRQAVYGVIQLDRLEQIDDTTAGEGGRAGDMMRQRLMAHVRDTRSAYYELLVAALPSSGRTASGSYIEVVTRMPLPGTAEELSQLSVDYGREMQSRGFRVNVQVEMAGPTADSCEITYLYTGLNELEERRAARTTSERKDLESRFASIMAGRPTTRLLRNLVPTLDP